MEEQDKTNRYSILINWMFIVSSVNGVCEVYNILRVNVKFHFFSRYLQGLLLSVIVNAILTSIVNADRT